MGLLQSVRVGGRGGGRGLAAGGSARDRSVRTATAGQAQQALMLRARQAGKRKWSTSPGQDGPDQWDRPVGPVPRGAGRPCRTLGMAARRASKPCALHSMRRKWRGGARETGKAVGLIGMQELSKKPTLLCSCRLTVLYRNVDRVLYHKWCMQDACFAT